MMEDQEYQSCSGVIIIGAPGTGKTTFCNALQQFFQQIDRKHAIVNLDPANENMEYECAINVHDLITLEEVMEEFKLGPNGSMIYCMEFLETNIDWLVNKITEHIITKNCKYFIFDLPGQVEIYSNHSSLKNIMKRLSQELNMQLGALHLVDCTYLYDKHRFLSALMLSLTALIGMEMPFINAITKIDLMKQFGRPDMNLSFYNSISGLQFLFFEDDSDKSQFKAKYGKLTKQICDVVEQFNLVSFSMLDISNKFSMCNVIMQLDKASGFFYDPQKLKNPKEMEIDYESIQSYMDTEALMDIEDKYLDEDGDEGGMEEDQQQK